MNKTIEQLKSELAAAEKAKKDERQAIHDSVKPVWRYTIEPATKEQSYDRLWDDTIVYYVLKGEIVNETSLKLVGWTDSELSRGSMRYMFNRGTGKIVCSAGGGTLYISSWYDSDKAAEQLAIDKIGRFLVDQPEGGDVTTIVNEFQASRRSM